MSCVTAGHVPNDFKQARVIPIYNTQDQLMNVVTREGFLRKNIVAVSFFQNCAIYTSILNTCTYLFH